MTATVKGKLEELGYRVVRNSSYYFVYDIAGDHVKTCHGYRSLTGWVHREYKKKIG